MIVISDTSSIISLIKADKLKLLEILFSKVYIPNAVYQELVSNSSYDKEAQIVRESGFIIKRDVKKQEDVTAFRNNTGLDLGESEAIILTNEMNADSLIIDERKGRQIAKGIGINIIGTVGILLQAHSEHLISSAEVEECLEKLKENNIRLSENLLDIVFERIRHP